MVSWKLQPRFNFITSPSTWPILTNWQIFISMKLNLNMMWPRSTTLWFNFNFWIYVDSGIITDPIFHQESSFLSVTRPISLVNFNFRTYSLWNWTTNFGKSHSIDGKRMWILIFLFGLNYWTNTDSWTQSRFFWVSIGPEPITLEPKLTIPPSHILLLDIGMNIMIPWWFSKTGHIKRIIFMIGSCMILLILGL